MTQEDKELLLKDLSARLPYGVIVEFPELFRPTLKIREKLESIDKGHVNDCGQSIEFVKPFLRSMSSITKEEVKYKLSTFFKISNTKIEGVGYIPTLNSISAIGYIDWLNAHHFDFRNLIERGLALEAPDGMYNLKEV